MRAENSSYLRAISADNSLPIEKAAVELWVDDVKNPFRWALRPLLQFIFAILLHVVWFIKRLPFPQFRAHDFLQKTICWFCKNFVSYEANMLILRHYAAESNIINFIINNGIDKNISAVELYPTEIDHMRDNSFVDHDQELFRAFEEMAEWESNVNSSERPALCWDNWRSIDMDSFHIEKKKTQIMDFESSHALFMCLFCLLLTRDEYRDAINGFNLDQSMAIRIGKIVGEDNLTEMAYNKYPHYMVGPWNLGQRFLMHGFFVEYMYAHLETIRQSGVDIGIDK
ncbi:MAG: hypothetical protein K6L73_00685 [Cellvibrionaceae bacterium]